MPKTSQRTTEQQWQTFLRNHSTDVISLDFFTVPTITFRLLHVWVFLSYDRRKIIHFNVTDHPTSEWATQQWRNAFYDQAIPKFLIRDRDSIFGENVIESVSALGLRPMIAAYPFPGKMDIEIDSLGASVGGGCLDHLIIVNNNRLRKCLERYFHFYHNHRTHLGLNKDSPEPREVPADRKIERVAVARRDFITTTSDTPCRWRGTYLRRLRTWNGRNLGLPQRERDSSD